MKAVVPDLIYRVISLRACFILNWIRDTPSEKLERIYAELTDLIQQGIIRAAVEATYPLDEYPAAPAHAQRTGRNDKVPFAPANGAPLEGAHMSTLHFHETTTSTPEQFIAGLADFGPGRAKLFGNSADEYLKVHDQGPSEADVTEGSGGVWERLHYDWHDPNRVVMTTTDSNVWGGRSGHTYTFTQKPDGTTDIDAVVIREGKNVKGRVLGFVLGTVGKGRLEKAFVKAIEIRNGGGSG